MEIEKMLTSKKKVIQLYIHSMARQLYGDDQVESVKEQAVKTYAGSFF